MAYGYTSLNRRLAQEFSGVPEHQMAPSFSNQTGLPPHRTIGLQDNGSQALPPSPGVYRPTTPLPGPNAGPPPSASPWTGTDRTAVPQYPGPGTIPGSQTTSGQPFTIPPPPSTLPQGLVGVPNQTGYHVPGGMDLQQVVGGAPAWGKFGPTIGGQYYGGVWGPNETGGRGTVVAAGSTAPPGATNVLQLQPGQAAAQGPGGAYYAYNPNDPYDVHNQTVNQPVMGPGAAGTAGAYVVPGGSVAGGQTGLAAGWQNYLPSTMQGQVK